MFDREIIESAKAHALESYPLESCGIVAGGAYHRIDNTHAEPGEHFRIDPSALIHYRARFEALDAIVHSHPNGPAYPSYEDQLAQRDTATAWGIVVVENGMAREPFWFGDQAPIPPLIGRVFRHAVTDCYQLVRDWYRLERGILLPFAPRRDEWWEGDENLLVGQFREQGFELIDRVEQPGDCVLGRILSNRPNHSGVYLGRGLVLHHLQNRLSRTEPIGPWMKYVTHHLRYTGV